MSESKKNPTQPSHAGSRGFNVLVVDDSEASLEATARYLRLSGHTVYTAGDGQSAIAAARDLKPQKVLLDLSLPDMDGYEVISRMKALSGMDKATFIALTGFGEEEEERAIQAGFDYFLTKPIDMEWLIRLLETER